MGRTWTQAPSNLPPHPPVCHGNLALQPWFRRTFSPTAPRIGPYNPGARAPLSPERWWCSRLHLSSPLWRGPFRVTWALRPQRPLPTGISIPGARATPLALIAGRIYASISATLFPFTLVQAVLYGPSPAHTQPILLYHVPRPITAGALRALSP